MAQKKDEGLNGNEKIEQAVCQLQQEPTQEQLAHTLTVIRRRMRENGQVVVAVEAVAKEQNLQLATVRTEDGRRWFAAFTSFEEEMKGGGAVKSTFLADIQQLFETTREADVAGVILNPWNRRLALDQTLLAVVLGI